MGSLLSIRPTQAGRHGWARREERSGDGANSGPSTWKCPIITTPMAAGGRSRRRPGEAPINALNEHSPDDDVLLSGDRGVGLPQPEPLRRAVLRHRGRRATRPRVGRRARSRSPDRYGSRRPSRQLEPSARRVSVRVARRRICGAFDRHPRTTTAWQAAAAEPRRRSRNDRSRRRHAKLR